MDVLLIPAGIICEKLTDNMLAVDDPCMWTLAGGKCATCGGTHFVNSLMNGHIIEAFHHNEYLFLLTVYRPNVCNVKKCSCKLILKGVK